MEWTLAATALAGLVSGAVYAALAVALWRREGDDERRFGLRAFALYWGMVAAYQVLVGFEHALAAVDLASFGLVVAVRYLGLGLAAVGLVGLLTFFAYLLTGVRAWLVRLAVVYAVALALVWLHVWRSVPVGVALSTWAVDVAYANDFNAGPLFVPLVVMFQLVPIVGALWYLTLVRKATDAGQRRRILAVGLGVSLQLLGFLVARVAPTPLTELVARLVLTLVVSMLVLVAYFTPYARPQRGLAVRG